MNEANLMDEGDADNVVLWGDIGPGVKEDDVILVSGGESGVWVGRVTRAIDVTSNDPVPIIWLCIKQRKKSGQINAKAFKNHQTGRVFIDEIIANITAGCTPNEKQDGVLFPQSYIGKAGAYIEIRANDEENYEAEFGHLLATGVKNLRLCVAGRTKVETF